MVDATVILAIAAIIGAFGAIASPVLVIIYNARAVRALKSQEYEREDEKTKELAEEKAKADATLLSVQREAGAAIVKQAEVTTQIHALVNSSYTASLQDQLDTKRQFLILLKAESHRQAEEARRHSTKSHTQKVKSENGIIAREAAAEIERTEATILHLEQVIDERMAATRLGEEQVKTGRTTMDGMKQEMIDDEFKPAQERHVEDHPSETKTTETTPQTREPDRVTTTTTETKDAPPAKE